MAQASVIPREHHLDCGLYNVDRVNIHNIDFVKEDKTLLTHAVLLGDLDTLQVLLEMGANPNGMSSILDQERMIQRWEPPLVSAARLGNLAIVQVLADKGAMLDLGDSSNGRSALYWACAKGHSTIIRFLVGRGANVNQRNNYADTPLVELLVHKDLDAASFLLNNGLNLNMTINYDRDTALVFALLVGMVDFAILLVQAGADTSPINREYEDALAVALSRAIEINPTDTDNYLSLLTAIRTLLASGARAKPIHLSLAKRCPRALAVEDQLLDQLKSPASLFFSSIHIIRSILCSRTNHTSISELVNLLPLPPRLQDYVKLELL